MVNGLPIATPLRIALLRLLCQSLSAWEVHAQVEQHDNRLMVSTEQAIWIISAAPPDAPFRWMLHDGYRRHTAASVVGILRTIRAGLDPSYQPVSLRVGVTPQ